MSLESTGGLEDLNVPPQVLIPRRHGNFLTENQPVLLKCQRMPNLLVRHAVFVPVPVVVRDSLSRFWNLAA